jgi:hypothetical protein
MYYYGVLNITYVRYILLYRIYTKGFTRGDFYKSNVKYFRKICGVYPFMDLSYACHSAGIGPGLHVAVDVALAALVPEDAVHAGAILALDAHF